MSKIEVSPTIFNGVLIINQQKFEDNRGFFSEMFNEEDLREAGINFDLVQVNYSWSKKSGTIRGLHYQIEPFAQAKIVRCNRGAIFDVAVDLRSKSPTFGKYISFLMFGNGLDQNEIDRLGKTKANYTLGPEASILISEGFAHGFSTLTDNTEVIYFLNQIFNREADKGIRWDDPHIAIEWPLSEKEPIISEKDKNAPFLRDAEINF